MHKTTIWDSIILQFLIILMALLNIYAFTNYVDFSFGGKIYYILLPGIIMWITSRRYYIPKLYLLISFSLFLVAIFQNIAGVESPASINIGVFARITPLFVLVAILSQDRRLKIIEYFGIAFYIIECTLSIYERVNMMHLIDYRLVDELSATSQIMEESSIFRSFSLMFHPLYNANVVTIFLSFIICNKKINVLFKYALIALGIGALWGFNSRAALLICAIIVIYRFFLYDLKIWKLFLSLSLLYILLPLIYDWLLFSGYLGRLEEFDFTDGSSLTRIEAWNVFFEYKWTLQDILIGGRILNYGGFLQEVSLENGLLLDLGYWGIIAGSIKVFGEIIISYSILRHYAFKDKMIIMIAIWGVAFMNNNSHDNFLIPMYVLSYSTFINRSIVTQKKQ